MDSGTPRNAPAAHMHGFLTRDGLAPTSLLTTGRHEVLGYGAELVDGSVTEVARSDTAWFRLVLDDGRHVGARRLLVATGLRDQLTDVPGLGERWARDVLHCPYCHGYEVRDQRLGVLGNSPEAVRYAQIVRQWSRDVAYVTPAGSVSDAERVSLKAREIDVVEGTVSRVITEADRLVGVELRDGRVVRRDALFVPPRFVPNSDLLVSLGCDVDEHGWPSVDPTGLTSVPGVWVAGNVGNPRAQVITAAGEGSAAAIAINADLVDDDVRRAMSHHTPSQH